MKRSIILCLLALVSATSNAQDYRFNCQDASLLFPKQSLSTNENLDVVADYSEVSKSDRYLLTGNVSLNSSAYFLAADDIQIQKTHKTLTAKGHVKYQDNELMLTGESALVNGQTDHNKVTLQQLSFHYPEHKINGKAGQVVHTGANQVFDSVSYSLCPIGNTDW